MGQLLAVRIRAQGLSVTLKYALLSEFRDISGSVIDDGAYWARCERNKCNESYLPEVYLPALKN